MGLFDSIKSVFGGGASSGRGTDCVFIVDAEKLADSRDGRTGPVERFRAIQQLSRFAEREKVEIIAVLGGRPLREVANGDSFNNVRVFYVEENNSVADQIEKALGSVSSGRKAVVITNDKQFDTRLNERGVSTLRVSTLRKAFEGGNGDSNGNARRGGNERRERRRGPRPDRPDRGDRQRPPQPQQESAPQAEQPSAPRTDDSPGDTVDGLIDRV